MDARIGKLVKAAKRWGDLLGIPALIFALLIAGLIVIARQFFGEPMPLDTAIRKDLQNSEEIASEPAASATQSSDGK